MMIKNLIAGLIAASVILPPAANAQTQSARERLKEWRETREHRAEGRDRVTAEPDSTLTRETFEGREMLLHIAPNVPAKGRRALVIVLHGGMGNAGHIQSIIGMDEPANEGGFIIAYLNGSPASDRLNKKFRAWNAGGECCGQPFKQNVDDIGYITRAVGYIAGKYGVDSRRVFGMGHSNGAMMVQRLMCETNLLQAAIPISGPLNTDVGTCPGARGKDIWAIHGSADRNVPPAGGFGTKGITNVDFNSQDYTKRIFETSGAIYRLDILSGIDHSLANIAAAVEKRDQRTLGRDAALFFGLAPK
jgi:poly(3-hydroxybutyrate) depolymerase